MSTNQGNGGFLGGQNLDLKSAGFGHLKGAFSAIVAFPMQAILHIAINFYLYMILTGFIFLGININGRDLKQVLVGMRHMDIEEIAVGIALTGEGFLNNVSDIFSEKEDGTKAFSTAKMIRTTETVICIFVRATHMDKIELGDGFRLGGGCKNMNIPDASKESEAQKKYKKQAAKGEFDEPAQGTGTGAEIGEGVPLENF